MYLIYTIKLNTLINDEHLEKEIRFENALLVGEVLQRVMPLSRSLFKYLGFVAVK